MTPIEDVEPEKPLVAYGLDSLASIELQNWMANELDAPMTSLELMSSSSLMALARAIAQKSKLVDPAIFAGLDPSIESRFNLSGAFCSSLLDSAAQIVLLPVCGL